VRAEHATTQLYVDIRGLIDGQIRRFPVEGRASAIPYQQVILRAGERLIIHWKTANSAKSRWAVGAPDSTRLASLKAIAVTGRSACLTRRVNAMLDLIHSIALPCRSGLTPEGRKGPLPDCHRGARSGASFPYDG
jgi:hypothetical protein